MLLCQCVVQICVAAALATALGEPSKTTAHAPQTHEDPPKVLIPGVWVPIPKCSEPCARARVCVYSSQDKLNLGFFFVGAAE